MTKENYGRDHHPCCFSTSMSMSMAGGGVKPGIEYGETDEFGYHLIKHAIHIRDLNATILHQTDIDCETCVIKHPGLDQRLTAVR